MRVLLSLAVVCSAQMLVGCAGTLGPAEIAAKDFCGSIPIGHATKESVARLLGQPHEVVRADGSSSNWSHIYISDKAYLGTFMHSTKTYVLTTCFDDRSLLTSCRVVESHAFRNDFVQIAKIATADDPVTAPIREEMKSINFPYDEKQAIRYSSIIHNLRIELNGCAAP